MTTYKGRGVGQTHWKFPSLSIWVHTAHIQSATRGCEKPCQAHESLRTQDFGWSPATSAASAWCLWRLQPLREAEALNTSFICEQFSGDSHLVVTLFEVSLTLKRRPSEVGPAMPPQGCMGRRSQEVIMTFTNLAVKGIRKIRWQVEGIYCVIFSRSKITGCMDDYINCTVRREKHSHVRQWETGGREE